MMYTLSGNKAAILGDVSKSLQIMQQRLLKFCAHNFNKIPSRIILCKRKFDHITTDVRDRLHWLPVQQRIEYKVCVLVYKCMHQAAPAYLTELCSPVSGSASHGHLRSIAHGDLVVPCSRTMRYGERCFAVSGPSLQWNSPIISL